MTAPEFRPTRRALLALLPVGLAGCVPSRGPASQTPVFRITGLSALMPFGGADAYGAMPQERFPVPAVDLSRIDPKVLRRSVRYTGSEPPGTIVVDTRTRRLNLVQGDGTALQYGVGVGREGLAWNGRALVGGKAEWPRWIPTKDMIAREPEKYARWAGGMDGGLGNPIGARALYLHQNGRDTYYRIHGTNEPWTIGSSVSSGCIRMINQDVIDLYERVPVGATVVVI